MSNKIYKVVDGRYFEGDLYTVTDVAGGKKRIIFDPSTVVTPGTIMDAEKFNQFQKNSIFYVNATHSIDGGKSVYSVEDFSDDGGFGLFGGFKLMIDPPINSVGGTVVSLLGNRYPVKKIVNGVLVDTILGDILKGLPITLIYDNGIFKLQNVSQDNKLDKGANLKATNARQLEEQIENLSVTTSTEIKVDKLIIKTGIVLNFTSGSLVEFDTSFPNECLSVELIDYGSGSSSMSVWKLSNTLSKTGFNAWWHRVKGSDTPHLKWTAKGY